MKIQNNQMSIQLKETSQLTGACWAIWLEHTNEWEILSAYKLNAQSRSAILSYIQTEAVEGWLNGAMTGRRSRSRSILRSIGLPGSKLFVFPDQMTQRVIVVGAENLSDVAQRFWRVVAYRKLLSPKGIGALGFSLCSDAKSEHGLSRRP